jgi:uncharacterized membrane protein
MLRHGSKQHSAAGKLLAVAGLGLVTITGWLGGELINRHGIGVHDVMGLNAPSSWTKAFGKKHAPN